MDFVSYTVKFLNQRLEFYESKNSTEFIFEAKILLKFLEDIKDEGYRESYEFINKSTKAINRLKSFIKRNNDTPFKMEKHTLKNNLTYKKDLYELDEYLNCLKGKMKSSKSKLINIPEIFYDILEYSKYIFKSAKQDTAYCFLLRDTLLSFFAFESWNDNNKHSAYPLFISRKYLSFFDIKEKKFDVYNEIQNIIFTGLDKGIDNFDDMKIYVREQLLSEKNFDKLIKSLKNILNKIKKKNIMIIESGYIGTILMLLSALDDRVDFRLFSTIPFFYEVYSGKYYTDEFQKLRSFETIQCQDALFKLDSIQDDKIKVQEVNDNETKIQAFAELSTWNELISINKSKIK